MDLEKMFPEGVSSIDSMKFLVKLDAYYHVIADKIDGAWVLNTRGEALTGTVATATSSTKAKKPLKPATKDPLDDFDLD